MEPEILPEGSPVPLNDLGGNNMKENPDKEIPPISTVVPLNPKPWLRKWENLQTHLDGYRCKAFTYTYVGSVHSVRVELTPIFTVYLEICSLLRDLSGAFKGLSSFFPFRNNIIMD